MASYSGWTINGVYYRTCDTVRLSSPITTYHRDGKRMNHREWVKAMRADEKAEAKAAQETANAIREMMVELGTAARA